MTRDEFEAAVAFLTMGFLGRPYLWGGDDPIRGFDCSGLAQEILASLGEDPPGDQTAQALFDHYNATRRRQRPELGGLAFFGVGPARISHVGFCISDELMLEAGGGGRSTTTLEAAAQQNAYVRIRPIASRKDLVAVFLPKYRIIKE